MTLRVAAVQHDIVLGKAIRKLSSVKSSGRARCWWGSTAGRLSEMFSTGFTMNSAECAESLEGPSYEFLVEHSTRHGIWISGSVPTRWDDQNCLQHVGFGWPRWECLKVQKIHPFSYSKEPKTTALEQSSSRPKSKTCEYRSLFTMTCGLQTSSGN